MHGILRIVETYRLEAERARDLAARTSDQGQRRVLLRIAEHYEELALKAAGSPSLVW